MPEVTLPADGWTPRWYQLPVWKYLEGGGRRAVLVWPRRHGKDNTAINWCATATQMRVGTYWHILPYLNQGRRIVWDGMDRSGRPFLSAFPEGLIAKKSNVDMSLHLKNGSVYQVMGADKPDKLVGSNPVGVIFSEWALMDPNTWKLIAPILAENGGWALWIYTPRGDNHGKSKLEEAKANPSWYWSKETAKTLKVLSPEELRELRDELNDEALFQQEMFTSFETPISGAYYGTQMRWLSKNSRITSVPIDPRLPVHTAWDLGYDDATSIWFFQQFRHETRVVDYFEYSGEGLPFYVRKLKEKSQEDGYVYGRHFFPWDVKVHELSAGKTRKDTLRELGINAEPAKKLSVADGIDAVRARLSMCWFDKDRCERGINALKSYTKEWNDERQVFKTTPLHNWASHGADAFRTLAVSNTPGKVTESLPEKVVDDYDPLTYQMR